MNKEVIQSEFAKGYEIGWREAILLLQTNNPGFVGELPDAFRQALAKHDWEEHHFVCGNGKLGYQGPKSKDLDLKQTKKGLQMIIPGETTGEAAAIDWHTKYDKVLADLYRREAQFRDRIWVLEDQLASSQKRVNGLVDLLTDI